MKLYIKTAVIFMAMAFVLFSCEDTFEEDLSNTKIILNAPENNYRFFDPNISFWWQPVLGANNYNIQIMQIDTNNNTIINLVTDSNLTECKFLQSLSPGNYKWGVKAYNGAYQTEYTYQVFYIDSTLDISNISLILTNPIDNYVTNDTDFTFTWQDLYNADYYSWSLRKPDENGTYITGITDITTNSINTTISEEGTYAWAVIAHNNLTNTDSKKTWRSITIDKTKPEAPDLLLPENNDTLHHSDLVGDKINFSWTALNDDGSELTYTIYIASDTNFTNELLKAETTNTTYLWPPDNSYNKFFWRISTSDAAGNESDYYSEERKFWYFE